MKTLEVNTKNSKKVEKMLKSNKPTIILYYMHGCSHCTALHPTWKETVKVLEKNKGIDTAEVELGNMVLLPDNIRKNIAGFPTIHILKGGKTVAEYMGDRSGSSIKEFAEKYADKTVQDGGNKTNVKEKEKKNENKNKK
jgi:thioredoxin-like negative regulator of GroEL